MYIEFDLDKAFEEQELLMLSDRQMSKRLGLPKTTWSYIRHNRFKLKREFLINLYTKLYKHWYGDRWPIRRILAVSDDYVLYE